MLEHRIPFAAGSDFPISKFPILGLHAAVTGRTQGQTGRRLVSCSE
jgi:predicted amidohydrolase YtcJ